MTNNTDKSAEVTFTSEDAPTVEGRWYAVRSVAVPSIQEKLSSIILAAQPQPAQAEQLRPSVNVEVANAAINSTAQQLSAHEQALEAIRKDVAGKY
jgi:hypothetical protein